MTPNRRKLIFDAAKRRGAVFRTLADVRDLDAAIDAATRQLELPTPSFGVVEAVTPKRRVSPRGIALMHQFEGCRLDAYPDPGSRDGHPWTIGYGSTGPGIAKGVRWTQEQADARFAADLDAKYGKAVNDMLGDAPTTQSQFDALVSLCYNIGIAALKKSTVMRKHKAGDYPGAAAAFNMWVRNDGKIMRGLVRRRLAESDLYDDDGTP